MKLRGLLVYLPLIISVLRITDAEPVTATFLGISALTIAGVTLVGKPIYCVIKECCQDRWIRRELPNLRKDLEAKVYGQHLAIDSVVKTIRAHLRRPPRKALVLSFHGWTGTGKNLVASVIAQNLYDRGMKSKYVHVLSATKDFARHEKAADYKDQIQHWVEGNVSSCPRQLFIFDEVEKMPDGVLDTLKPFLDHYDSVQGIDYRSSIFLFLGNAGGETLYDATYNHYQSGGKRDDLEVKDMEKMLWTEAYNTKGGLKVSSLITSNLVSHYIPFLPLEKRHVRQCVNDELENRNVSSQKSDGLREKIISQLSFTPEGVELYSISGCKRVHAKIDLVMEEEGYP
ncbi:torsin-1A-like [Watersipora subatra]|uniref:torsin-1A-like n=1 Tax=Watersipora subatra TaxID=2589382 RepID=UPI00355C46FF